MGFIALQAAASTGAQRYGTRGLKLSAAYLSRTMDVDVDAGEDSSIEAETGLVSGDEDYGSDHAGERILSFLMIIINAC